MSNTPDNEARTILGTAIAACNHLIVHLNQHPGTFPQAVRQRMIEADYLLNSAADDVSDFVGQFPPPNPQDQMLILFEGQPAVRRYPVTISFS